MANKLIEQLRDAYEDLAATDATWRDHWGESYGLGPDAQRKMAAIKALAHSFGYEIGFDYEADSFFYAFDARAARANEIPRIYWPEELADLNKEAA